MKAHDKFTFEAETDETHEGEEYRKGFYFVDESGCLIGSKTILGRDGNGSEVVSHSGYDTAGEARAACTLYAQTLTDGVLDLAQTAIPMLMNQLQAAADEISALLVKMPDGPEYAAARLSAEKVRDNSHGTVLVVQRTIDNIGK